MVCTMKISNKKWLEPVVYCWFFLSPSIVTHIQIYVCTEGLGGMNNN